MSESVPINRNISWLDEKGSWLAYVVGLAASLLLLVAAGLSWAVAWCLLTVLHGLTTLFLFHFRMGAPAFNGTDMSSMDQYTWWEQVDNGELNTDNRKFLTLVPLVLFMFSSHYAWGVEFGWLAAATLVSAIILIAKLPLMHNRRLFGLNRAQSFHFPTTPTGKAD